jgi:peptide/nickel transport system permease protein
VSNLLRRGVASILLFGFVVTLTFVLAHLAPGDATDLLIPPTATAEDVARLRAVLGLDASLGSQYVRWVSRVGQGDLGVSFALGEPVVDVLRRALPVTLGLGAASLLLTFVIGVLVGLWQARRAGSWPDRIVSVLTIGVYAAPTFWLSLTLVAVFTYVASRAAWPEIVRLPAMGLRDPRMESAGLAGLMDLARHAVLPVTVLTAVGAAGLARYTRAAAIGLREEDWVRTARAKGASEGGVWRHHILANARPTLIVLLALSLPGLVAGSVFVEGVFAWPGMGRVLLASISARDYPVLMGATLVYAALVIVANWLADLGIAWADPRRRA